MIFLGIDPGASGGVGNLSVRLSDGRLRNYHADGFKNKTPLEIYHMIHFSRPGQDAFAILEKVHAMPKQGVSSTFKFGQSFGMLEGYLVAAGIPHELVSPAVWQRKLGCLSKGDKNVTKAAAQRLFPDIKITHATADALLLAEYGRRIWHERYGG